jgi:hypothetical protein
VEAIPKSVREHAKLVLLDTVGVILGCPLVTDFLQRRV